jgi:hypothetical protein
MENLSYKSIHFICRRDPGKLGYIGLEKADHEMGSAFSSEKWDLKPQGAQSLLGGLIFLHLSKSSPAHTGGLIFDWSEVEALESARTKRIKFYFLALADAKYATWQGIDHSMAYTSGIHIKTNTWERDVPINQRHVGTMYRKLADIPASFIHDLQIKAASYS